MSSTTASPPSGVRVARRILLLFAALAVLALAVLTSIAFGSHPTSPSDVMDVLYGTADPNTTTVVQSRYPRTALGLLAGLCLAIAGTLMQSVTRNPLADPGLLGITAGAAAAIVTATAFLGASGQAGTVVGTAWSAAGRAARPRHRLSRLRCGPGPAGPGGAVVSAVLMAYVQAVTLSRPRVFDSYRYWVVGALGGRNFDVLTSVLPLAALGLALALLLAPGLNTLALGDESASALGADPALLRSGGLLAAILLSTAATAAVGPIAFVGLAVPHIVRALVGVDVRLQIVFSAVVGPALLLLADVAGRIVLRPQELMVGVVTAFVGAPALLLAVRRMKGTA